MLVPFLLPSVGAESSCVLGLSVPLSSAPIGQGTCSQPWVDLFF